MTARTHRRWITRCRRAARDRRTTLCIGYPIGGTWVSALVPLPTARRMEWDHELRARVLDMAADFVRINRL